MIRQDGEEPKRATDGSGRLGQFVLLTYPFLLTILALQTFGSCYRFLQSQISPKQFCTDKGEGLSNEERVAVAKAKRWVEANMMGNAVSLDARYRVRETEESFDVHVVFVTGYSSWGTPLFLPNGHCFVRLHHQGNVEMLVSPFGMERSGTVHHETPGSPLTSPTMIQNSPVI